MINIILVSVYGRCIFSLVVLSPRDSDVYVDEIWISVALRNMCCISLSS